MTGVLLWPSCPPRTTDPDRSVRCSDGGRSRPLFAPPIRHSWWGSRRYGSQPGKPMAKSPEIPAETNRSLGCRGIRQLGLVCDGYGRTGWPPNPDYLSRPTIGGRDPGGVPLARGMSGPTNLGCACLGGPGGLSANETDDPVYYRIDSSDVNPQLPEKVRKDIKIGFIQKSPKASNPEFGRCCCWP
jgi:hypothetical protein